MIAYLDFGHFPTLELAFIPFLLVRKTVCPTTGVWTVPGKRNSTATSLAKWIEGAIERFCSGVKNSRVIELHDTCHYVFIVDEALIVREMRKFLLDE